MFYKVVRPIGGRLFSLHTIGAQAVLYIKGEVVRPSFGKLFVFDSLEEAIFNKMLDSEVWECEVENPEKLLVRMNTGSQIYYKDFWINKDLGNAPTPRGTFGVDSVKLLNRIINC